MATLTDLPSTFLHSTPSLHSSRTSFISSIIPFPLRSSTYRRIACVRSNVRFSIAGESTVSPAKTSGQHNATGDDSASVDCVVVGGGISGLCIAQALSTKHANAAVNLIVTEAKDRVGGNITTIERDGYLWEEGPNSFQPSDPMLTMVVRTISTFVSRFSSTFFVIILS